MGGDWAGAGGAIIPMFPSLRLGSDRGVPPASFWSLSTRRLFWFWDGRGGEEEGWREKAGPPDTGEELAVRGRAGGGWGGGCVRGGGGPPPAGCNSALAGAGWLASVPPPAWGACEGALVVRPCCCAGGGGSGCLRFSRQGEQLARPVTVSDATAPSRSVSASVSRLYGDCGACLCRAILLPIVDPPCVVSGWVVGDSVGVLWGGPLPPWPWLANRKHERTVHDKSRPFACDQCNRTFGEVSGRGEGWQGGTGGHHWPWQWAASLAPAEVDGCLTLRRRVAVGVPSSERTHVRSVTVVVRSFPIRRDALLTGLLATSWSYALLPPLADLPSSCS